MTSCGSSSSSRAAGLALLAAAALASGCAHAPPPPGLPVRRVALFPVYNVSGGPAPARQLAADVELAVAASGLEVVSGAGIEGALAKRRIRYLGGLDREGAQSLREDLGVDAVVIPSVELYMTAPTPRLGLSMRLVGTDPEATLLWVDAVALSGDERPGLLGVGRVTDPKVLERRAIAALAGSLREALAGRLQPVPCGAGVRPRLSYRSPVLDDASRRSIAVLPFVNLTGRRDAGEVMVQQMTRALAGTGAFEVIEPGVVRRELLDLRLILEGGISVDQAQLILQELRADMVLAGTVRKYQDNASGTPGVEFSAHVLDRRTGEVVWSSSSRAQGDDGVFFFGLGRVGTAGTLACRLATSVVERMNGGRSLPRVSPPANVSARPAPDPPLHAAAAHADR